MDDILDWALLDSDSSDDDLDDLLLYHMFNNENLGNRADLYRGFSFEEVLNTEASRFFRFQKQDIPRLTASLAIPDQITTPENITLSGLDEFCILLRRPVYPNRLLDLKSFFGYSYGALSSIINVITQIIINNKGHLLPNLRNNVWLKEQKLREYSEAIRMKGAPANNKWAFIDGKIRPVCRPTVNQREYYSGHKRVRCVKYQSVLCPDGIVVCLKGAWPRHDADILRESGLYEELEEFPIFGDRQYVIYGDQEYGLRELLIKPFSQNEIAINLYCYKDRNLIM